MNIFKLYFLFDYRPDYILAEALYPEVLFNVRTWDDIGNGYDFIECTNKVVAQFLFKLYFVF